MELRDFIEIARPGLVLTIARPEGIAHVVEGEVVTEPLPDDLVGYLQDFEGWDVVAPTPVTVAGYDAVQFNGTVTSQPGAEAICGRPCSVFFSLTNGGSFLVFGGDRVRVTVVDVDGVDVVFVVDIEAGTGSFERGLQTAEQVLRTVEFVRG